MFTKKSTMKRFWTCAGIGALIILGILFLNVMTSGGDDGCNGYGENPDKPGYCRVSENDYDQVIIITGNTQNSPAPDIDFTQGELKTVLHDVFYNTAGDAEPNIAVISAAGHNYAIEYNSKNKKPDGNLDSSKSNFKKLAKELNKAIKTPAEEGRANYVGAINEARSLISATSENPVIVIVGSGYSDTGALDFAHDELIEAYNNEGKTSIARILEKDSSVKKNSLDGTDVYWYNLGNVTAPQPSMNKYRDDTKEIYKVLFNYLGVDDMNLDERSEQTKDDKSVATSYTVQPTFVDHLNVGDEISVNFGEFEGDSDALLNRSEVRYKLSSFVNKFKASKDIKLELTGYIAYCAEGSTLGLNRAKVIKSILVDDLGVAANKIIVAGEPGSPPESKDEAYTCDSTLPDNERRTVMIRVKEG